MAITQTSTTNFSKFVETLLRKQLEELLRSPLPHMSPGSFVEAKHVKGSNGTVRFLNIPDLSVVTGAVSAGTPPWLTEGTAPTGEALTFGYEEFTVAQAGRVVDITDVAEMENIMDLVDIAVERLARNILATADQRISDVILAGTNVIFSDATATQVNNSTDDLVAADVLQARDVRRAVAYLKASNVPTFPDGSYRGIIHPFVAHDLKTETGDGAWLDVARYATPESLLNGEIGKFAGVRFIEASSAAWTADAGAADVDMYSTVIHGPRAWAVGDYNGAHAYVTPPGGQSDPLHQRTRAGWKSFLGAMLIGEGTNASNVSEPRYIRIESASSLGENA